MEFKNDDVRRAFEFAMFHHSKQIYADDHPYILHLYDVTMVLLEFGFTQPRLLCAAWMHDIIEDTECNYSDVKSRFGEEIADIVYAVTDELGKNRNERKEKTLPKLDGFHDAQVVKLADVIANVRQCHRNGNKMYKRYHKEYASLEKYKGQAERDDHMNALWNELDKLLSVDPKEIFGGMDVHHREYDD